MKIIDMYKEEYDVPDKVLNAIHREEYKNFQLIKCFGEYPSSIHLKTNKRISEEVSEEEYRKKFVKELKSIEKCVFKCKLRSKCLMISLLQELREIKVNK